MKAASERLLAKKTKLVRMEPASPIAYKKDRRRMSENVKPERTVVKPTVTASVANGVNETIASGSVPAEPSGFHFAPSDDTNDLGRLGPYRVVKQLGRGGMGAVFLAFDTRLNRKLALKVMLPEFAANDAAKERFLREAKAAAQITHDNVVTVYEADERDGIPFIAMQFLQGYPLDEYLKKKGRPSLPQVVRIARETAAGLAAAHKIGLVHRDIKPGNLWLEAPNGRVKVLDFGLAKPVDAEIELTKSGAVIGTPAFMSPEQGRGQKVDHRSDLFSLGAVMYLLCTGKLPFEGPTVMAVLIALGHDDPTPVRELNPDVQEPLAELIHKLLAKDPNQRPQSADEVVKQLRAIAENRDEPIGAAAEVKPQVVYVPIQVSAQQGQSVFADLDATSADTESAESSEPAKPKKKQPKRKSSGAGTWLAAGIAIVFAVLVVAGVIIIIKNKDGTETKIEVPDSSTVTIKDNKGKTIAQVKPDGKQPPLPLPPVAKSDPNREAAKYVLSLGAAVRLQGNTVDTTAEADLPDTPFTLEKVWLRDNKRLTAEGMAVFKDCKDIRHLDLVGTPVTDTGLAYFKNCKEIDVLDLNYTAISDEGIVHFKGNKSIVSLWLGETKVGDDGVAIFSECARLYHLALHGTNVTDKGLAHFKDCKNIGHLYLGHTKISNEGLAVFKECKNLATLSVPGTDIDNDGLKPFFEGKMLKEADLRGTKVSAAGVAALQKAYPQCKIMVGKLPVQQLPPKFAGGLEFDGKASYVEIPTLRLPAGSLTVEAWINPADARGNHTIFACGGDMHCSMHLFQNTVGFWVTTKNGMITINHAFPTNITAPVHVAGVWDGKEVRVYINGREGLNAFGNSTPALNLLKIPGTVGTQRLNDPPSFFFRGVIHELRVSTSARYANDFTPGTTAADKATLLLYKFSDNMGDKLTDSSGNNHHGKIKQAKWVK